MLDNIKIKSLLQQTKRDAFLMGFLPSEKVNIEISADVETACWSFIPPHRIVVGNEKNHSNRSDNFIQALLWHELSHAKWTERNFEKINKVLMDKRVPFKLYNLFEDARIEHLFREETGKKFNWIKDIPNKKTTTPVEIFYSFVNNEGVYEKEGANSFGDTIEVRLLYIGQGAKKENTYFSINNNGEYSYNKIESLLKNSEYELNGVFCIPFASTSKSHIVEDSLIKSKAKKAHGGVIIYSKGKRVDLVSYESKKSPIYEKRINVLSVNLASSSDATFNKVVEFYNKACNALSSMEIIDICAEWLKEFPDSYRDEVLDNYNQDYSYNKGKSKGNADIISPEDMKNISGESISGDENNSSDKEEINEMLSILLKGSKGSKEGLGRILQGSPETFDETRLNKLTQLFKGIIKRGMVKYNSIIPSKKINIRNYILGSDKIFKKQQYDNGKSEKLSVILDCSGSMSGSHLYAGKELLIIINRLAKQGLIRGNIILTESSEQVLLPMPVDEKIIHSIQTGGGEGFKATIEKYGKILKESEKVFIFTDGEIGDEPDADYNRKLGIKTYGLYVGEKDQTAQLKNFFNEAISKTSLEDVINELLKLVK